MDGAQDVRRAAARLPNGAALALLLAATLHSTGTTADLPPAGDPSAALCADWRARKSETAKRELARLAPFDPFDMELILAREIGIGMSEKAMLCILGPLPATRTLHAMGEDRRYVYRTTRIYLRNGVIEDLAD